MKRARVIIDGAVQQVTEADILDENAVTWLPPVEPGTIFALGLNYADHAKELSFQAPEEPLVFLKGPNTLCGHLAKTRRPAGVTYMHYECELAVVIGKTARGVSRSEAYDYVAGYTVANDYAIRDYLENYYRPNFRVKSRDASTPLGPWLVDAADIPDPMNLSLRTTVNGKITQEGSTRDMIFTIPVLIEYLSGFMTLGPGDLSRVANMFLNKISSLAKFAPDKMGKSTLFEGDFLFAGLNSFEPGQEHAPHAHQGQDKLYVVLEGSGVVRIDGQAEVLAAGDAAFAPTGVVHSIRNPGTERLVVMVVLGPPPSVR